MEIGMFFGVWLIVCATVHETHFSNSARVISWCKWLNPINISLNIWGKNAHLFLDIVRVKRPVCSGANSISGGTFSEKAFLAGTQYFRSEKKKLEIINIKWQLDYILSWGQNDTKKTYHMACTRNKQWATNAKLFYFQLFHHYIHTVHCTGQFKESGS